MPFSSITDLPGAFICSLLLPLFCCSHPCTWQHQLQPQGRHTLAHFLLTWGEKSFCAKWKKKKRKREVKLHDDARRRVEKKRKKMNLCDLWLIPAGGGVAAVKHGGAQWGGSLDRKGGGLIPSLSFLSFPFFLFFFIPPSPRPLPSHSDKGCKKKFQVGLLVLYLD